MVVDNGNYDSYDMGTQNTLCLRCRTYMSLIDDKIMVNQMIHKTGAAMLSGQILFLHIGD